MRMARPVQRICSLITLVFLLLTSTSGCTRPITARDSSGREVTLAKRPERIVSLAPSNTEILFALGLGDLVKGVTSYCNYPPEAKAKPTVGGFMDSSLEKIVSLRPDLVLATSGQDETVTALTSMGIPVVVLDAATVSGIAECIKVVGDLSGRRKEAQRLTSEIAQETKAIKDRVSNVPDSQRPKVLYLAWDGPILTVGPGTLIHDMITLAGGRNVAAAAREAYPVYSMEMVLMEDPDVILMPRVEVGLDLEALRSRSEWRGIKAVKEGRVFLLEDDLVSRPGPRAVQGLLQIAEALYPDKFGAKAP